MHRSITALLFSFCMFFMQQDLFAQQYTDSGWNIPGNYEMQNQPFQQTPAPAPFNFYSTANQNSHLAETFPQQNFGIDQAWGWHLLPPDIIYKAYMAGPRESRFYSVWNHDRDYGWLWDVALGGRVGILRYGSSGVSPPEGWQLDMEGAAFPRLTLNENRDLKSADFRFGIPLTYSSGPTAWKIGYYHMSSHVGDEYWEKNPTFQRINYVRETIVMGGAYFPTDNIRLYGEFGYAFFNKGGSEPWEVQYGAEFNPVFNAGVNGTPFAAVNAYHKQDRDWSPTLNAQVGWQWRGTEFDKTFRVGLSYQTGPTVQYQFLTDNEDLLGVGMWYDY